MPCEPTLIYFAGVKRFWTDEEKDKWNISEWNEKKENTKLSYLSVLMDKRIFSGRTSEILEAFLSNTLKRHDINKK